MLPCLSLPHPRYISAQTDFRQVPRKQLTFPLLRLIDSHHTVASHDFLFL